MKNRRNGGEMRSYIRFIREVFRTVMETELGIFKELSTEWII